MLGWALTFLVIALIAALLGFTGIAVAAAGFARILFYIFLVLLVVSLSHAHGQGPGALGRKRDGIKAPWVRLRRFVFVLPPGGYSSCVARPLAAGPAPPRVRDASKCEPVQAIALTRMLPGSTSITLNPAGVPRSRSDKVAAPTE